ncbi:LodA/GoxA family CTQ-dependent oxidase [Tenacibaculum aiptasiae]|uniref:LodA/GoxA family CTQ-dependent oxidase n=1 Tax=Tenacibaculum aiptasiae TaxID=426481 RepID=UPI003B58DF7F
MKDQLTPKFRIYPSIGIARMGNGPANKNEVVFSPEVPWKNLFDVNLQPHTPYGALKKQAQRFYIYKCDKEGNPIEKIHPKDYKIEWSVEVANKKPFWYDFNNSLDLSVNLDKGNKGKENNKNLSKTFYEDSIAPGISASSRNPNILRNDKGENIPNSRKELINGPNYASVSLTNEKMKIGGLFPFPRDGENNSQIASKMRTVSKEVSLGTIEYDKDAENPEHEGSLIFYSGDGISASLNPSNLNTDFADNSNWYDDICDGRVTAKVTNIKTGETYSLSDPEAAAWIATAPPDYAPQINPISSLYDLVTGADPEKLKTDEASCLSMVLPLFFKFYQMQWVNLGDFLSPSFKEEIDQLTAAGNFSYLYTPGKESQATREAIFQLFRNPRYDYINEPIIPSKDITDFNTLGVGSTPLQLPYYVGDGINYPGSPAQWFAIPPMLYDQLKQWSEGNFTTPESLKDYVEKKTNLNPMIALGEYYQSQFINAAESVKDGSPLKAPLLMTRAVLETLYGGGFHPGVELTWPMRHNQMYCENTLKFDAVSDGKEEKYNLFGLREIRINSVSGKEQEEVFFKDFGFLMTPDDVQKSMDKNNPEYYWLWKITPGDLTKWMGIPWQSDAGSCQAVWTDSQYPVPAWWAANLPIDVLNHESYEQIKDTTNTAPLPDTKRNLYANRLPWLHTTDTGFVGYHAEGGYLNGLINMVYKWDQIGMVSARALDLDGYPKTVYVSMDASDAVTATKKPLYELFNGKEHLYTDSANERDNAEELGYTSQGIACRVYLSQIKDSVPFYRLYNGADHFYTASVVERDNAEKNGYTLEGVAGFVYLNLEEDTIPFYRLYNGVDHYYTTSKTDRNKKLEQGYKDEGIACYVFQK